MKDKSIIMCPVPSRTSPVGGQVPGTYISNHANSIVQQIRLNPGLNSARFTRLAVSPHQFGMRLRQDGLQRRVEFIFFINSRYLAPAFKPSFTEACSAEAALVPPIWSGFSVADVPISKPVAVWFEYCCTRSYPSDAAALRALNPFSWNAMCWP